MASFRVLSTLQLNRALLARQLLLERRRVSVPKAVHLLGGLQSQEPRDPHLALWSRLAGFDSERLMAAARKTQLVRATYLRGTLHTVAADDYAAFRMLLQPVLDRVLRDVGGHKTQDLEAAARAALKRGALTAQQIAEAMAPRFPKLQKASLAQWARLEIPLVIPPTDDRWGYPRPPRLMAAEELLGEALPTQTPLHDLVLHGSRLGRDRPGKRAWTIESEGDDVTLSVKTFERFPKATLAELEQEALSLLEFLEPQAGQHRVRVAGCVSSCG